MRVVRNEFIRSTPRATTKWKISGFHGTPTTPARARSFTAPPRASGLFLRNRLRLPIAKPHPYTINTGNQHSPVDKNRTYGKRATLQHHTRWCVIGHAQSVPSGALVGAEIHPPLAYEGTGCATSLPCPAMNGTNGTKMPAGERRHVLSVTKQPQTQGEGTNTQR